MASSNSALKKSELSALLSSTNLGRSDSEGTLDQESDILSAVKKRFSNNAIKVEEQSKLQESVNAPVSAGAPSLQSLTQLIANVTEAYTAALFKVDLSDESVELVAAQTLSRDIVPGAKFSFGQGLVGWVAENRTRVQASPFELDSTTLMFYSKDQELKSFIALPIFGSSRKLLGVLAVDSKKCYAFNQMAEKVICDCAIVAGQFFELSAELSNRAKVTPEVSKPKLELILETLRAQKDEASLLAAASDLPEDFIRRDALVVLSLSENGTGKGVFYSRAAESIENNRLLEIVCRHKKLISSERSVQALRADELGRTFLSIPIRVLQKEAGALNLLSHPDECFSIEQINSLEAIALTVGRELERCRLVNLFSRGTGSSRGLSTSDWKGFESRANQAINMGPQALIRFSVSKREELESKVGIETLYLLYSHFSQLLEQLRGSDGLVVEIIGSQFLLLAPASEKERILGRLAVLLSKSDQKSLPTELTLEFLQRINVRQVVSSSTLRTVEQLRKKLIEEASEQPLKEFISDLKPRLKRPLNLKQNYISSSGQNASNGPAQYKKSLEPIKDKDWNW